MKEGRDTTEKVNITTVCSTMLNKIAADEATFISIFLLFLNDKAKADSCLLLPDHLTGLGQFFDQADVKQSGGSFEYDVNILSSDQIDYILSKLPQKMREELSQPSAVVAD